MKSEQRIELSPKVEQCLLALEKQGKDRQTVINEAVIEYFAAHADQKQAGTVDPAFGAWAGKLGDGLDYQKKARKEWAGR